MNTRHAILATALAAATITGTATGWTAPTNLPIHARESAGGWPHHATPAEFREATRFIHRYTRHILPPKHRRIRTTTWTNRHGDAGLYAFRIRNHQGGTRGVPRVYRSGVLRVWEDGSWELTYRGRIPNGTSRVTYDAPRRGSRASSAVYQPGHTVNRGR